MLYVEDRPGRMVSAGMTVVTEAGDRLPPGLLVGTLSAARVNEDDDLWHLEQHFAEPLRHLTTVTILDARHQ